MSTDRARAIAISRLSTWTGTRPAAFRSAFSSLTISVSAWLIDQSAAAVVAGTTKEAASKPTRTMAPRREAGAWHGADPVGGSWAEVRVNRRHAVWVTRPEQPWSFVRRASSSIRRETAPLPTGLVRPMADGTGILWDDGPDDPDDPNARRLPMATTRQAEATWSGDLLSGRGTVTAATTRVFADLPTTWASRTGEPEGVTSPEELLAAAHASCFSMACSNNLAKAGTPPSSAQRLGRVTADKLDAGWTVQSAAITVRGIVPGATPKSFRDAAEKAKDGCPISQALKGNVELTVEATLEG